MDVIFCIDGNFIQHFMVTAVSMIRNNPAVEFRIHLFGHGLTEEQQNSIRNFIERNGARIEFYSVPEEIMEACEVPEGGHITRSTFMRCFIEDILPADLHKVLYLDSDMVVYGGLEELWATDLTGKAVAAVDDMWSDRNNGARLGYDDSYGYFNAGMLLINLDYWREQGVARRSIEIIRKMNGRLDHLDQDVLNLLLHDRKVNLPFRFNMQDGFYRTKYLRNHGVTAEQLELDHPVVLHFATSHKPWHFKHYHPLKSEYYRYLQLTPYKDYKPRFAFKDWLEMGINKILWRTVFTPKFASVNAKRLREEFPL